jgi:hypothetical protein
MKFITRIIIITTLLVLSVGVQMSYAQQNKQLILPKPDSLAGPTTDQQKAIDGQGGVNGGYGVTFLIPFLTTFFVGFTGTISLIAFVYGGFLYVISFTDESNAEKSKKIMMYAAIGLGVAMLSYALVSIILKFRIG